ncbi:MAG: PilZ domain-containing protein [Nitrospirae bacterium]|nr:PilZ domain-containing protein [Nitrospirota bacterium]
MEKYFIDKKGRAEEYFQDTNKTKQVNFPLCLAVKYGDEVPMECPDFLLSTKKGKVFIETDSPLPKGSEVVMHFYIPPHIKLLSELKGKVIHSQRRVHDVKGNLIKIRDFTHRKLRKLEDYLEEKRHLIDEKV